MALFDGTGANTGPGTLSTMNGLFKEVYASKLENLIPDGVQLLNMIPFVKREAQPGNLYHQPVVLGQEHGVTYASSSDDAFALNNAINGVIKDAQIRGSALVLRSVLGYKAASSATESGPRAFESATKFLVGNMLRSITKKLEIELLYGQVGIGRNDGVVTASTSVPIRAEEWAPGIWAGAEGMPVATYTDLAGTVGGITEAAGVTVASVDFDTKTLTLSAAVTLADGEYIFHKGAQGNEFAGLHKILTNTGTLFNIDASVYNLWKGSSYSAGTAALSFQKLQDAIARAVEKGLDSDVKVMVNPKTWADLLNDQAALRMYDQSYKSDVAENGSRMIKFHGQNGLIEIVPSIYVKEGFAYVICMDEMLRVGSSDVTFRRPGRGDEFFRELEGHAGYELRAYTDQALFCFAPGRNVLITDIVN
jgi:hypothetical protein